MDTTHNYKFDELTKAHDAIKLVDIDSYINGLLQNKDAERDRIILTVDELLGKLQNRIQLLSVYFKQRYVLPNAVAPAPLEPTFYTKQEVALRYRVSMRTITNWIVAGLETTLIGGVIRISDTALQEFVKINKRRKYGWRSISRTRID